MDTHGDGGASFTGTDRPLALPVAAAVLAAAFLIWFVRYAPIAVARPK